VFGAVIFGMARIQNEQLKSMATLQNERAEHWRAELTRINDEILRIREWKDEVEKAFPSSVGELKTSQKALEDRIDKLERQTWPISGGS
jgi:archaellum component FlaC